MEKKAIIYTDGGYNSRYYSYGLYMLYDGKEEEYYGKDNKKDFLKHRNVSGELLGAQRAMELCLERNIKHLIICYDYLGVEKWATGKWKTNKQLTKEYKEFYDKVRDKLKVTFVKVKGHSNIYGNERADNLASIALE